jgi:MFS family permease
MMSGRIRRLGEVEVSELPAVAAPEPGAPAGGSDGAFQPGADGASPAAVAPPPGAAVVPTAGAAVVPTDGAAVDPEAGFHAPSVGAVPAGTPLGRLGPLVFGGHLSWALPANAAATLLQALFADQRADSKIAASAVITTIGAVASIVATVGAGALSDVTRSRYGRRNPWLLGGALVAAAGLSLTGVTPFFAVQVVGFAVFQAGLGAMLAALYAIMPDRIATTSMAKASALGAVGYLVGTALGSYVAAGLIEHPAVGIVAVPWTMVVAALLFWRLSPDRSNLDQPRDRLDVRALLRSLLPPDDADYRWAFAGRFCVILALFVVAFYQLYLMTDLLGLSKQEAGGLIAGGTTVLGVGALTASVVTGVISDRQGRRKPLSVGASLVIAAAALPLALWPGVPAMLAFYAVAGIGYGAFLAVDGALMVEVLPASGTEAKDLGVLSIANSAPVVLGPVVAAATVTVAGYRPLFVVSFVLACAGAFCIARIRRVR